MYFLRSKGDTEGIEEVWAEIKKDEIVRPTSQKPKNKRKKMSLPNIDVIRCLHLSGNSVDISCWVWVRDFPGIKRVQSQKIDITVRKE